MKEKRLRNCKPNNIVLVYTIENIFMGQLLTKNDREELVESQIPKSSIFRSFCEVCEATREEKIAKLSFITSQSCYNSKDISLLEISYVIMALNNPASKDTVFLDILQKQFFENVETIFENANLDFARKFY